MDGTLTRDREPHRRHGSRLASIAVLVVVACSSDPDPCAYAVCDVEDPGCVERVAVAVGCHRDAEPVIPTVRYLTRADVVAEFAADDDFETPDVRDFLRGEALVGLMPEGYQPASLTADSFENVAAFYSHGTREVTIITDGSTDPTVRWSVLVHELVHAHQDAQVDLAALTDAFATTFDRGMALRAMIEGDATTYELEATLEVEGIGKHEVDWTGFFAAFQEGVLEAAAETTTPALDASLLFPYAFGSEAVFRIQASGGIDAVEDALRGPPVSVRDVLVGGPNRDGELDPEAVPVLEGYTYLGGGHRSVWLLNAMLQRTAGSGALWNDALGHVDADYLSVLRHDESGAVVVVWRAIAGFTLPVGSRWSDSPEYGTFSEGPEDEILLATSEGVAADIFAQIDSWESPEQAAARAGAPRVQGRPDRRRFIQPTRHTNPAAFALAR